MKYLLPLIIILASCSSASKLRRAERLIKKAELDGAVWHVDTVYHTDTVLIESVRVDTAMLFVPGDTIQIEKDRLKIKIVRLPGDSIFVQGECAADTVYREVPVTVTKEIEGDCWLKWWHLVVVAVAGIVFGRVILKLLI